METYRYITLQNSNLLFSPSLGAGGGGHSETTFVLNTPSNRLAFPFISPDTANLTDIWFPIISYTGTWGNTDSVINYNIYDTLSANYLPSNVIYSGTLTLDGDTTGWVHISGLSHSLTSGKFYIFALHDADGNSTNYITIIRNLSNSNTIVSLNMVNNYYTNNDWTSGATSGGCGAFMLKIGNHFIGGGASRAVSTVTSGTYERGILFTPTHPCILVGVNNVIDNTLYNQRQFKLYNSNTLPGGTALKTWTNDSWAAVGTTSPNDTLFDEDDFYKLIKGKEYRFIFKPSANLTVPRVVSTYSNVDDDLRRWYKPWNGQYKYTYESDGNWIDDNDSLWNCGPILMSSNNIFRRKIKLL